VWPKLKYEQQEHVVVLTINDPATRNAINGEEMFAAFEEAVARLNTDITVRAAILTGEGTAFSSGGNITEMRKKTGMFGGTPEQVAAQYRTGVHRVTRALWRLDVPLIAAVNGPAIGLGCDIACMCDIRIASRQALFAASFIKVGLLPADGGAWFLPRVVGYSRAAEMIFTGSTLDATAAYETGLVSRLSSPENLMKDAMATANEIAANPPQLLRWSKRLLRAAHQASLETILELSAAYQGMAHHTADHVEALAARHEKRPPRFLGK
jgi:enoyl-CoA hydratase/carnithine racemase